jgi:hypothetical protein
VNFDCVFVNGDSYSAPYNNFLVYGDYISKYLKVPLINLAVAGSNNDRILRSSIEFVLSNKFQNPLIIIGWSFVRRLEVWYYGSTNRVLKRIPDQFNEEHKNLRFVTLDHLINENDATLEEKALINEDLFVHKQLTNFYTDLFLFSNYLKKENLSYFFFSGAKNNEIPIHCFPAIENLNLVQQVSNDKNIHQLHDFFIMDWAFKNDPEADPITGHLSESGHKKFANYLLTLLPL